MKLITPHEVEDLLDQSKATISGTFPMHMHWFEDLLSTMKDYEKEKETCEASLQHLKEVACQKPDNSIGLLRETFLWTAFVFSVIHVGQALDVWSWFIAAS